MSQRALALSTRALRINSRAMAPVLVRGGLIVLLVLAVWAAFEFSRISTASGPLLLSWVVWTDWALIGLLGIATFSAVLTEEKELMTLGLLRLAGFTPASLLLGKSIGLLLQVLLLIVVQVPFCMLAITFGGVTVDQVTGVFALLISYTLFVYGLALFCSVLCARNTGAAVMTATLLLIYHLLPWIVYGLVHYFSDQNPSGAGLAVATFCMDWFESSALSGIFWATTARTSFVLSFGSHITANLLLAGGLFALAWLTFDRFNRNEVPSAPARGRSLIRLPGRRSTLRSWSNALLWKDFRFMAGGAMAFVLRILIYGGFFLLIATLATSMRAREFGSFMMGASCLAVVLEAGLQLGRFLQEEVKAKTLGSLVALPHSLRYVIWSKAIGSLALCLPALGFVALGAVLAPSQLGEALRSLGTEPQAWVVIGQILFGLHLTVFFSLLVKRGALVLALATIFFVNVFFGMFMVAFGIGHMQEGVISIPVVLALLVGCGVMQYGVGSRVRRLASEE